MTVAISEAMRKLLFLVGIAALFINFGLAVGAHVLGAPDPSVSELRGLTQDETYRGKVDAAEVLELSQRAPPGKGIPSLAVLDGILLFAAIVMGLPFLLTHAVVGRVQGIVTLIVSLVALIAGVVLLMLTIVELLLMVGLFLAAPFGTLMYFALYGFFPTQRAAVLLGSMLFLKLAGSACFVISFPRFLGNKAMVVLILTSLVAGLVLSFLHGLVPAPLVSITDAIGAIIALVLGLLWGVFFLVRGLISVIRVLL